MRIVNQFGSASYDLACTKTLYIDEEILWVSMGEVTKSLGIYSGSERTKEVFDDIHNWIDNPSHQVYYMPRE